MQEKPSTLYIALGDQQVAIRADSARILNPIAAEFEHMLASAPRKIMHHLSILEHGDGAYALSVRRKGRTILHGLEAELLQHHIRNEIFGSLVSVLANHLWFHAGGVAQNGMAFIFLAPPAHGKSTLVTQLHERGYLYLSDELVPMDPDNLLAVSVPILPSVRKPTVGLLPMDEARDMPKTAKKIQPTVICREPILIKAFVFPRYSPGVTELNRCSPAETALQLVENCIHFAGGRRQALHSICGMAMRVPAFRLLFQSGDLAADLFVEKMTAYLNLTGSCEGLR
jgi:hypothetical protein